MKENVFNVKRAIIMAAGQGSRMRPVTLETPKPLVMVNGIRMIDTVIKALKNNGINEIHVVVGYLKEKFQELKKDFPELHFIENPYYKECNNISSLYVAREFIEDAIILDGDLIIYNNSILKTGFERSGYNAVWTDAATNEWLLNVKNDIVTSCSRTGGKGGWQLFSISRWTSEDGKKLRHHLEESFSVPERKKLYWDDLALFLYSHEYQLGIIPMNKEDVLEIDTFEELVQIDESYRK